MRHRFSFTSLTQVAGAERKPVASPPVPPRRRCAGVGMVRGTQHGRDGTVKGAVEKVHGRKGVFV